MHYDLDDYSCYADMYEDCMQGLRNAINGHIHEDRHGYKIDVREIDLGYALNLYNWYANRIGRDEFRDSVMAQHLRKVIEDGG